MITLKNIINRIKNFSEKIINKYRIFRDKDATNFIDIFRKGVVTDTFNLLRLKPKTIKEKKRLGYSNPEYPLKRKGLLSEESFANMLEKKKLLYGFRVLPKNKNHWSGKISLSKLLKYHEENKNYKRPAFKRAIEKWKELKKR